MPWTAASHPPFWPAHTFRGPAASSTSFPIIRSIAFAMMCLGTSSTLIGLTPGHLFRGIRWQATKALILCGFTNEEHRRRPTAARVEHRL